MTTTATSDTALGTYAKYVSDYDEQALYRWALQAEARAILPNERVSDCMRVPHGSTVDLLHDQAHQRAHYSGLVTCGSVWHDPICAAKVSERRRQELSTAIDLCNDQQVPVFMSTYTISHKRFDSLLDLLQSFLKAHRKTKQGDSYMKTKKEYGFIGTVRALEVTWGYKTGWHPHVHELVFTGNEICDQWALEATLRTSWEKASRSEGLKVNQHGFKLDVTKGAIGDYVTKYGHQPVKTPWGVEAELAKAHIKKGRETDRFTPFGLLAAINQGQTELIPVFREYATYFKGKRQLTWSNGLKAAMGLAEKSDEELAAEKREEAILLGRLSRAQWNIVLGNEVRGELLAVANQGDWTLVEDFLAQIGAMDIL